MPPGRGRWGGADGGGPLLGEAHTWDGRRAGGSGVPVTPRGRVVAWSRMGATVSGTSCGRSCQGSRMPGGSPVAGNAAVATPVTPPLSRPIRSKITAIATTAATAASVPATARRHRRPPLPPETGNPAAPRAAVRLAT
ncbi:hypothetical protein ACFQYP_54480 [Nonomuraea antimicrobica]